MTLPFSSSHLNSRFVHKTAHSLDQSASFLELRPLNASTCFAKKKSIATHPRFHEITNLITETDLWVICLCFVHDLSNHPNTLIFDTITICLPTVRLLFCLSFAFLCFSVTSYSLCPVLSCVCSFEFSNLKRC